MRSYSANILPTEAIYYTLTNATIQSGQLIMQANGNASISLDATQIANLSEHFCINVLATPTSGGYQLSIGCKISAVSVTGKCFHYFCNLTADANGIYTAELEMVSAEYDTFTVTFFATTACTLTLWELCPETSGDIEVIIDGVKQSLPRLLFDYNTWPISFAQRETTIALITCNLQQNTDLQGHFALTYAVSEATTMTLRFKDTESTELFAPVLYDIPPGRGTISVPHAYLHRLAGVHNFTVSAQVAQGTVTVGTRGILFTIDGGYLATRLLDIGTDARDLTIEQTASDHEPSYIWIIGLEAGELLVRRRKYTVKTTGVAFEPMFSLGPALDGAIEFDGEWHLLPKSTEALYRLSTYTNPYCFLIDTEHKLYVQRGDNFTTKTLIDTNVDKVSVCRGYKSMYFPAQDQGLIVLYLKAGRAWYTQYAYDAPTGTYMWSTPVQVTSVADTILDVYVQRLNDYRVEFILTTATTNYWLISERTYVGQSYKPEIVSMHSDMHTAIGMLTTVPGAIVSTCTLTADRLYIMCTINYPMRFLGSYVQGYLTIPQGLEVNVEKVDIIDNYIRIKVHDPLYVPYTITLNPWAAWQYQFQNQWLAIPNNITFTYDPYMQLTAEDKETPANFNIAQLTSNITQRAILYPTHNANDTATFNIGTLTSSVTEIAVNFLTNNLDETQAFNIDQLDSVVTQTLTGESPI